MLRKNFVSYNPTACRLFDKINSTLNWNGLHAENGGEFQVLQFHVDFYEPIHKVIIEYDERHHHKPKNKQRDAFRMKLIKSALPEVSVVRINETDTWDDILKAIEQRYV